MSPWKAVVAVVALSTVGAGNQASKEVPTTTYRNETYGFSIVPPRLEHPEPPGSCLVEFPGLEDKDRLYPYVKIGVVKQDFDSCVKDYEKSIQILTVKMPPHEDKLLGKHRARSYRELLFTGDRQSRVFVEVGDHVIWVLASAPKSASAEVDKVLSESLDTLKFDK
jgi:hypothetical protein